MSLPPQIVRRRNFLGTSGFLLLIACAIYGFFLIRQPSLRVT